MPRVVIVGGGVSGLTLAFRLGRAVPTAEIVLLEAGERVGGNVVTAERDGFRVEGGPNGFLDNKPFTLDLARELGLERRLVAASTAAGRNRFLLLGGKLRKLPTGPLAFLLSDFVSWRAKWALLTERFRPRRRGTDDESVDAFATRRIGPELAATLADAFVTGIHAGDPALLSAEAAFPRLVAFEREYGSVTRGMTAARRLRKREGAGTRPAGRMWSFTGGLSELTEALRGRLRRPPVLGVTVRSVRREGDGWLVHTEAGGDYAADAVALTCPAWRQAELVVDADAHLAGLVGAIPYNRVAVVALGYRAADVAHDLDGFGYLSPQRGRRDVLGVQWCSSIFPGRAPPGHVLLRALCGGWNRPDVVDWPEDRLVAAVHAELRDVLGIRGAPVFRHVVRWDRAIPQYHLGHLARVAAVEARLRDHPGLFLGGNAYRGVALNDCVEQAGHTAGAVADYLARTG